MKVLLDAIREKREAIARLEKDLVVLERAATLLRGGAQAGHSVPPAVSSGRVGRRKRGSRYPFNQKSAAGLAVRILSEAQEPLHVREIIKRMEVRGSKGVKQTSLVSRLSRLAKEGRVFKRSGANTFALLEWERNQGRATDPTLFSPHESGQ